MFNKGAVLAYIPKFQTYTIVSFQNISSHFADELRWFTLKPNDKENRLAVE